MARKAKAKKPQHTAQPPANWSDATAEDAEAWAEGKTDAEIWALIGIERATKNREDVAQALLSKLSVPFAI